MLPHYLVKLEMLSVQLYDILFITDGIVQII